MTGEECTFSANATGSANASLPLRPEGSGTFPLSTLRRFILPVIRRKTSGRANGTCLTDAGGGGEFPAIGNQSV